MYFLRLVCYRFFLSSTFFLIVIIVAALVFLGIISTPFIELCYPSFGTSFASSDTSVTST